MEKFHRPHPNFHTIPQIFYSLSHNYSPNYQHFKHYPYSLARLLIYIMCMDLKLMRALIIHYIYYYFNLKPQPILKEDVSSNYVSVKKRNCCYGTDLVK